MESPPQHSRNRQRILHKLAPARWRQAKSVRSEGGLDDAATSGGKYTIDGLKLPDNNFGISPLGDFVVDTTSIDVLTDRGLATAPGTAAPSYTPLPVPGRTSSAHQELEVPASPTYRLFPNDEPGPSTAPPTAGVRSTDRDRKRLSALPQDLRDALLSPGHFTTMHKNGQAPRRDSPLMTSRATRGGSISPVDSVAPSMRITPATATTLQQKKSASQIRKEAQSPETSNQVVVADVPAVLSNDTLAHLQDPSPDKGNIFSTDVNDADNPNSWDLVDPNELRAQEADLGAHWLEKRAERLYSADHLRLILGDATFYSRFLAFMRKYRASRVPILARYMAANKAIRAQEYANALVLQLCAPSPVPASTCAAPVPVENKSLHSIAQEAFAELLREDLHYFIAHRYTRIVSTLITRRVCGPLPGDLDEESSRLAEVFCLTDCRLRDNPIILASESFIRHCGGNLQYVLGRNCRFMQGPGTTVDSVRRFAIACQEKRDHTELLVNYRRDGTPFLCMVMNAPLVDSFGVCRYFLGAQVDVSSLLGECAGLESFRALMERAGEGDDKVASQPIKPDPREKIKALSETLSPGELDIIRRNGGSLTGRAPDVRSAKANTSGNRVLIAAESDESDDQDCAASLHDSAASAVAVPLIDGSSGNLPGVYRHYLLIRPAPSFRILFASPTMRAPGLLQTPFLHRVGGSRQVRESLERSLQAGDVVTARVRWLNTTNEDGAGPGVTRWLHCTPLIHYTGQVGLWMIVLVRPDGDGGPMHPAASAISRTGSVGTGLRHDTDSVAESLRLGSM